MDTTVGIPTSGTRPLVDIHAVARLDRWGLPPARPLCCLPLALSDDGVPHSYETPCTAAIPPPRSSWAFGVRLAAEWRTTVVFHTTGSGKTYNFAAIAYLLERARRNQARRAVPPSKKAVRDAVRHAPYFIEHQPLRQQADVVAVSVTARRRITPVPMGIKRGWLSQPDVPRGPNTQRPLVALDGGGRWGLRTPRGGVIAA